MSNWELLFFLSYLALQILLPFRRHFRAYIWKWGKGDIMADYAHVGSWTMKMRTIQSEAFFIVYDRDTGRTIYPYRASDFLLLRQAKNVEGHSRDIIVFAKFLEKVLIQEGLDKITPNFGIRVYCVVAMNGREAEVVIDESADMREEKIGWFGSYWWYKK